MLFKVDFALPMFRWLYNPLYTRVETFALINGDSLEIVRDRFVSLVGGSNQVFLLIKLEESLPTAHCLFILNKTTAFIEQIQVDSKHDTEFVKECIDYVESLESVREIVMTTSEKKYRAFRKKYEFQVSRVVMSREVKRDGRIL